MREGTLPENPRLRLRYEYLYTGLAATFATLVILTNTAGVKLFTAFGLTLPVSILWYPLTFLVTDVVSEVYGSRRARFLVVVGFGMSLLLLGFSQIGIALPVSPAYPLQDAYVGIFGPIWRLLFGSMAAYLLAQMIDVRLFHFFKRLTGGKHLWLRNNGSTMISQFVDSVTVNMIFLYKNPAVFTGTLGDLVGIILAVYGVKVAIAALDTPICYLGVRLAERYTGVTASTVG
ncbi:MAG: queuosine precursor transporter [Acidobacteriota bacterium]|nr:queuosine precursor transporter [Acidobacteriota bacterium]MDH3786521.1 queuosine precursor transporter [Acidobacteriota bacterium]